MVVDGDVDPLGVTSDGAPTVVVEADWVGRFQVRRALGEGGMGCVYLAWDPELEREVAVKLVRGGGQEERRRLSREARAIAQVEHPNVVTVFEAGEHAGEVYLAMEVARGGTLRHAAETLRATGAGWRSIVTLFVAAGRGLEAAHTRGLIHRDFKPENVLMDERGTPLVADFGLVRAGPGRARLARGTHLPAGLSDSGVTEAGTVVGTPAYMAPEQLVGGSVDARADQFAFCVALYEALYGHLPFRGESLTHYLAEVERGNAIAPHAPGVPHWVGDVLLRGLRRNPDERYENMGALLDEFDNHGPRKDWLVRRLLALVFCLGVGSLALVPIFSPPTYTRMMALSTAVAALMCAALFAAGERHRDPLNVQLAAVVLGAALAGLFLAVGLQQMQVSAEQTFVILPLLWGSIVLTYALQSDKGRMMVPVGVACFVTYALGVALGRVGTSLGVSVTQGLALWLVLRVRYRDSR